MATDQVRTRQRFVLEAFSDGLARESHHLLRNPRLLWQQVYNRLEWETPAGAVDYLGDVLAGERERRSADPSRTWLRLTTPLRESSPFRRTLMGHEMQVRSCAFSADGTTVASLSFDRTLRLWDTATGLEKARIATEPKLVTRLLAASTSRNLVACVREDFALCMWDSVTGRSVNTLQGHTAAVNDCMFSDDGRRIASASSDGTLRVWDTASGRELMTRDGQTGSLCGAALSRSGTRVVTAGSDDALALWNTETGDRIAGLVGHTDCVNWCGFSPDARLVASASDDETVRVWDAVTGASVAVLQGHTDAVLTAAFAPAGDRLLSAGLDGALRLWDARMGAEILVLEGHSGPVNDCAFSPDGQLALSASDDGGVGVWDAGSGRLLAMLEGHSDAVNTCAFAPDGRSIVSAGDDKTVKLWDVPRAESRREWNGHADWVVSVAFSSDSRWAATGGRDRLVRLWDPAAGGVVAVLEGHTGTPGACAIAPTAPLLVSASSKETLSWVLKGSGAADLVDSIQGSDVVRFSHDGGYLLLAQAHSPVLIDLRTGEEVLRYQGHQDSITCACFSADDRLVVSGSGDRTLRLWDRASGAELATLAGHADIVTGCAISPDGRLVVSASRDKTLKVWDVPSGREQMTLSGHTLGCTCCDFAPDGGAVLSGSSDMTVRSWDVATGEGSVVFYALGCIECLAFSPDGTWLCAGDWGGNTYMLAVEGSLAADPQCSPVEPMPEVPGVVEFFTEDLLHKFGFGDGDMLYDLVEEHDLGVDDRDLLVAVVEALVVPRLDQSVETYTLGTLHNPIRAHTVDGEEADIGSTLTPEFVEVPVADIIRVARTLPPAADDGESL